MKAAKVQCRVERIEKSEKLQREIGVSQNMITTLTASNAEMRMEAVSFQKIKKTGELKEMKK